jgi:hypothetical protein
MTLLKAGTRLRSAVCTTEIIVVVAPARDLDISCGGAPMLLMDEERPAAAAPPAATDNPTLLGKRYTNADGDLEVLCTKAGDCSLAVSGECLMMKEAKPLPSSD